MIPEEMIRRRRWVCFDREKIPRNPHNGKMASSTGADTWGSLEEAQQAVVSFGFSGIGFVLGDGISGIDIDHCVDPDTKELSELAVDILDRMPTYAEYSPSGTGVHILWIGVKPDGASKITNLGLEMYSEGRYFTVTGNALDGRDLPLADCTEQAAEIHRQYMSKKQTRKAEAPLTGGGSLAAGHPDVGVILEKAKASKGGEKLSALLAGDWQGYAASQSEADLALCNLLAFWLGGDARAMDEMFRNSGLYRPKWDQRRGGQTYGEMTIARALSDLQEVYSPPQAGDNAEFRRFMGSGEPAPTPSAPAPGKIDYSRDDTGNAERFRDLYQGQVLYNHTRQAWMVWDKKVWRQDEKAEVKQRCDEMLAQMERSVFGYHDEDKQWKMLQFCRKSRNSSGKENLLKEARHLTGIAASEADFDRRSKSLLNLGNGVLLLGSRRLADHDPDRRLTRIAPVEYDASAKAPVWESFIRSITGGDDELARYIRSMVGYMLTGSTREQVIFFLYGSGSNGKSTFLGILSQLFGSYAMNAQSETITARRPSDSPRTDIARLKGARLVIISESPENVWLDEAVVKQLTGDDTVTARQLYGKEFEFKPEFKMIMGTNHKPRIRGTDNGIWRRIRLIPFTQSFSPEQQDLELPEKLAAELPGILNWALDGLADWQARSNNGKRRGLPPCAAVDEATAEYRTEQDRLQMFLDECTIPAPEQNCVQANILYQVYLAWAKENGEKLPFSKAKFGREVSKVYRKESEKYYRIYMGVALTAEGVRLRNKALRPEPEPNWVRQAERLPAEELTEYEQTRLPVS